MLLFSSCQHRAVTCKDRVRALPGLVAGPCRWGHGSIVAAGPLPAPGKATNNSNPVLTGCYLKEVPKRALDFSFICVAMKSLSRTTVKQKIKPPNQQNPTKFRVLLADLMMSKISRVKGRCKSVFDDIYTQCCHCHMESSPLNM